MSKLKISMTKDIALRDEIMDRLKDNDGYCPCRLEKNDDNKCMCKEFREQYSNGIIGECHCGLYVIE